MSPQKPTYEELLFEFQRLAPVIDATLFAHSRGVARTQGMNPDARAAAGKWNWAIGEYLHACGGQESARSKEIRAFAVASAATDSTPVNDAALAEQLAGEIAGRRAELEREAGAPAKAPRTRAGESGAR